MPFALSPLYPILDASFFPSADASRAAWLRQTVQTLAEAGVTLLQLRAKQAAPERILRDAEAAKSAAPPGMRLILNDHVELVRACGFDGVHLGQGDTSVEAARRQLGPAAVIGLSTHTIDQVRQGSATDANYLAIGPVFATESKADAEAPVGVNGVRAARVETTKPLVAIGGITLATAADVHAAGADSIALISALFRGGAGGEQPPGEIARDFLLVFR